MEGVRGVGGGAQGKGGGLYSLEARCNETVAVLLGRYENLGSHV